MFLKVEKLSVDRGIRRIIENLSFKIAAGESLLLTGPNGSGKTTLLRALAGFLRQCSGTITLKGGETEKELSEQCHFVGHLNGVKAGLTVAENTRFWADYLGGSDTAGALERFGLAELRDIPAGLLSAGQKRRLGLSRLVLAPRPVWFLDEPSVSLDVASVEMLAGVVAEHVKNAGLVVAASHIPLGLDFTQTLELGQQRRGARGA